MGKLISLIHISLDGYMADTKGKIDWLIFNDELNDYVTELRQTVRATVYGRITYQIMESFWPVILTKPDSPKSHTDYAQWVDKTLKVVVSKTLSSVAWNNTRLIKDNVAEEIKKIKKELDGDLLLLASATLTHDLLQWGLIDEFQVTVNPVILGSGVSFYKALPDKTPLKLMGVHRFNCGVVGLHYEVTAAPVQTVH